MNATILARYLILGLLVLLTACSSSGLSLQPNSTAPLPTALPTQTTSLTPMPSQQATQRQATDKATSVPATATQAAVAQPEATSALVASGKVTAASIAIEREEGSGKVCTVDATYFVHASITADGATTASYEILSSAGQILAGYFEGLNNENGSPYVSGTLVFDQADTKAIDLRFVGPYPYPNDITVILRVNGGEFHNTKLSC